MAEKESKIILPGDTENPEKEWTMKLPTETEWFELFQGIAASLKTISENSKEIATQGHTSDFGEWPRDGVHSADV